MSSTYRFGDASRPGLLVGLAARQAVPLIQGVLWMALAMQTSAPVGLVVAGPIVGVIVAFGRVRGAPLSEVAVPASRLWWARRRGRACWVPTSLLGAGPGYDNELPGPLAGLELLETRPDWLARTEGMAVVRDRQAGTVTAVLRATGSEFPLAAPDEQDELLARWEAALAPLARELTPVASVCWQAWAHPVGASEHLDFLAEIGALDRAGEATDDYRDVVDHHAGRAVNHDVLISVTIDQRRVRAGRSKRPLDAAVDAVVEEVRLLADRLAAAHLAATPPLSPLELSTTIRLRSDPTMARQATTLQRSLAAACRRGPIEWGPMAVEPRWGRVAVDGTCHRTYRVGGWPLLPVSADWLSPLATAAVATRTITVVMQPVPTSKAARAADREVMGREADADMKTQRGFRVSARERKRLADVRTRERELTEGHPEFRFVGLVDVCAETPEALLEAAAATEQAAAQSLVDLRPLEARHHLGWVASLPLGRNIEPTGTLR